MTEEHARSPVAQATHAADSCCAAYCIIRHEDVRRFWCERCGSYQHVSWDTFWCELFAWLPPGSCAAVRSLRTEQELREKCQLIMTRAAPSLSTEGVSAIELNLVFSPQIPLIARLSELVAAARQVCSSERISLAVVPQSDVHQGGRAIFKQAGEVYTSQCFTYSRERNSELHTSIFHHLSSLDTCCKCLAAMTGTIQHRAAYSDIDAACLHPDVAGLQHDVGLPSPVSTFSPLTDALLRVKSKLQAVCNPVPQFSSSGTSACWPHILSLVGPRLSGKSALSKALADTVTMQPMQPPPSGLKARDCSHQDGPTAEASVQHQPGPAVKVKLTQCHSLEECVQVFAATMCARTSSRDISAPFRLILPNSIVILDDVDMVPCQHIADLVRILLSHTQVASIILTSCNRKLLASHSVSVEVIQPWHVELCAAFIISKSILPKAKSAHLVKLSRGIPGLLSQLLSLVTDRLYCSSLPNLVKSLGQATGGSFPDGLKPSEYVQLVQQSCLDLVLNTEDSPVRALVSGVCSLGSQQEMHHSTSGFHTDSLTLALAASIAQARHPFFPIESSSKAQTNTMVVEDLAMVHPAVQKDRPAGMGYFGKFATSRAIPVSAGLTSTCARFHDGQGAEPSQMGGAACGQTTSTSSAEGLHQALQRCSNLGILDVESVVSGSIRVSCCHARTNQLHEPPSVAHRIAHKYVASLAHLACRLFCTVPQTAAVILQQFSDIIWQSLIQLPSKRTIDCLYDIFPLLHMLYHIESMETLLLKAMNAAQSMGAAWYAKVLVCCIRLHHSRDLKHSSMDWRQVQAAVEDVYPHPSYTSIAFQMWAPFGRFTPEMKAHQEGTNWFLESRQQDPSSDISGRSRTLLFCDWVVLQANKALCNSLQSHGNLTAATVACDLRHTLKLRMHILSKTHPLVWDHMILLAIVLHASTTDSADYSAAKKVMQRVVDSQKSVLIHSDSHLLYNQQYLIHLALSDAACKSLHSAPAIDVRACKLAASASNVCAICVCAHNLLHHISDATAAAQCLLPVFQLWCSDNNTTHCQITQSCLHMLMESLIELNRLEECELVALAVLQKLGQHAARSLCSQEPMSTQQLTCLAVLSFRFFSASDLTTSAWRHLAKSYLYAGMLLEAGAAASKGGEDPESLLVRASVLHRTEGICQELTNILNASSSMHQHAYHFYMLNAAMNLKQDRPSLALQLLDAAESSTHASGKEQGDIIRMRAACFHKLERHDLHKECLFQSTVVVMNSHGEKSHTFACFLKSVAIQLMHENKMKRALAMLQHALSIFDQIPNKFQCAIGHSRCLSLLSGCHAMRMKLPHALSVASDAVLICKNLFWPHTAGEKVAYHLRHLWTIERLQATERQSALCKALLQSSTHVSNTKLQAYRVRHVAEVAVEAFLAYSRVCQDLQLAMTCACNALLCSQFATGGQGITTTLAWCQVCTCATMRLLQQKGYRWQILQPWNVQPSLSHHALLECLCEHALKQPHIRKSIATVLEAKGKRDVAPVHDETETLFLQILQEVPCRGVKDMQLESVKHLCKRCNRRLSTDKKSFPDMDTQMQVVFAYLLFLEEEYGAVIRVLTDVAQMDTKSDLSYCIQVEALCLLAAARTRQNLLVQAAAALQQAAKQLNKHGASNDDLQLVKEKWSCYVLHQLGIVNDKLADRNAEDGELCWRQCMVMFYNTGDNSSCAHALTRIAGCVWMRWILALHKHGPISHSSTEEREFGHGTAKVALGQAMSAEVLNDAVKGSRTALRVLHNTCTSLMWRALSLLQKDDSPAWSMCGCLVALAQLFKEGILSEVFGLESVTCMIKALDCSKQAVALMGLQLEGDGLEVADVSMHTELERAVLHAALQFYVDLLDWARASWETLKSKAQTVDPHQKRTLQASLEGIQGVKAAYLLLTCSFKGSNHFERCNTLLYLGNRLRQLLDMKGTWIQGWKRMLIPFYIQEISNIKRTFKEIGEDAQAHDLIQKMELVQQAVTADQAF